MKRNLYQELVETMKSDEDVFEFIHQQSVDGMLVLNLEDVEEIWFSKSLKSLLNNRSGEAIEPELSWDAIFEKSESHRLFAEIDSIREGVPFLKSRIIYTNTETTFGNATIPLQMHGRITTICTKKNRPRLLILVFQKLSNAHDSNVLLDQIIDQSPFATWISDAKGFIQRINSAQQKLIGIPEEEFVGKYNVLKDKVAEKAGIMPKIRSVFEEGKIINFTLEWDPQAAEIPNVSLKGAKKVIGKTTMFPVLGRNGELKNVVAQWIDITNEAKAHKKIEDSHQLLNSFVENFPNDAWAKDLEGKLTLANQYLKDQTLGRSEVVGKTVFDLFPTDVAEACWESEKQVLANGKTIHVEEQIPESDGIHSKILTKFPLYNSDGETIGLGGIAHDRTHQKKAEEALKASELKYRLIAENTSDIIWVLDVQDNAFRYISPSIEKILGFKKEEIEGKGMESVLTPRSLSMLEKIIPARIEAFNNGNREIFRDELLQLHKNGSTIFTEVHAKYVRNKENGHIEAIGTTRDITERKNTIKALKLSESRLAASQQMAQLGNFEHDFEKDTVWWSDELYHILGFEKTDNPPTYATFRSRMVPEDAERLDSLIERACKYGEDYSLTYRYKFPRNQYKYIYVNAQVIYGNEKKPIGIKGTGQDITKLKEAEIEIKESQRHYRSLFDNAPIPIWEEDFSEVKKFVDRLKKQNIDDFQSYFDTHPEDVAACSRLIKVEDVNRAAIELHEAGSKEALFEGLSKIFTDESYRAFAKELVAIAKGQSQCEFESTVQTLKGKEKHILLKWQVVPGYEETLEKIYITTNEISKLKLAESQIKENERKLRLAINNSPLGICINDLQGKFVSANKAFEKIVGYTEEELKELTFFDITHPDYLPRNKTLFESMKNNEHSGFAMEKKYLHKQGHEIDVRLHTSTMFDSRGEPMLGMAFVEDITERKLLEGKNVMLSNAIDSSPIAVVITDPDANIEYVNPSFCKMTGYSVEEVIGENPKILKSGLNSIEYYEELWETLLDGKHWSGEIQNKKKDGTIYWENIAISPVLNSKGETIHFVCVKEDITQLKAMLLDLKEAKTNAEQANALKNEFLHNMSHEIRTPMNGIIGFASLLDTVETSSEERKFYTKIIQNSSEQLLRVIDDILEISTLETKQLRLQEESFSLNDFMVELFSVYDIKSKSGNLALYVQKGLDDEASVIISDKAKLHKILSNLLDNAFKFTSEGSIEFGYLSKGSYLEFYVKDTGIGISPENQEKIFERFSQENKDTAQNFGGLGLGLSIAKENAQLLGGELSLVSSKGNGSRFSVKLPYTPVHSSPQVENKDGESINTDQGNTFTVLIAEDEEVNFLYLETLLNKIEDYTFKIVHAINGEEAVNICLEKHGIDLVLMDMKMPVLNGYLATQKLKQSLPDLPVIAQTAYSTENEKHEAARYGCDDFISKPIDETILRQLITKYLPASKVATPQY